MVAVTVLAAVLLALGGLWLLQRRLIYFPESRVPPVGAMGADWEDVSYDTADGLTLRAWYRQPDHGQPVVVVFNGNAGNRADRGLLGSALVDMEMGVLLVDYRGYGGNPGQPTEYGLAADARAAVSFARRRAPGAPVVYFGESLGAAVAVELAVAEPPAVLILRSPFTSLADVGRVHYPWLPVGALLKDRYPSTERIGSVRAPTLVIAGDADSIVPLDQSRAIFEAAAGHKRLVVITGADHNDHALLAGAELLEAITGFVAEAIGS